MRITQQMSTRATLAGLQYTQSRLSDAQSKLSSGRQITKPSDDPSGTVTALELRSQVKQSAQYQTNANSAISWLSSVDTTMGSVNAQLQKARTLVVQGLSSGTSDSTSNNAIADQIDGISKSLLALANTTYLGRPIFGGTTSATAAFTSTSGVVTYTGDTGTINRDVGPSTTVQVNQTGTSVFGVDASNVWVALSAISAALRTSPSSLTSTNLTTLDGLRSTTSAQQSIAGAAYSRVQTAQSNVTADVLSLKTQLSTLEDIDIADMAIQVSSADTAYQAALATTAKASQRSLLDFVS